jgi:hypothetical protein
MKRLFNSGYLPPIIGLLCAVSFYVLLAAGPRVVPKKLVDYVLFIGLGSVPLLWLSTDRLGKWQWRSAVIGLVLTLIVLVLYFFALAVIGVQKSHGPSITELTPFAFTPLLAALIFLLRRPTTLYPMLAFCVIGFVLSLAGSQLLTRVWLANEIKAWRANGGTVHAAPASRYGEKCPWREITSISDVNFGVVIGSMSERVLFMTGTAATTWRYTMLSREQYEQSRVFCAPPKGMN